MAASKKLLVCDLDNTLYDWVAYFVPAFYAMVDEVVQITGCNRERLLDDFRDVHRKHHDSEHPFALLETRTVKELFGDTPFPEIAGRLDSAFHAFNIQRKQNLRLYAGVRESLRELSLTGMIIVAHTESRFFAVVDRLRRLGIDDVFRHIYCREGTRTPHPYSSELSEWTNGLSVEKFVELTTHRGKPDPDVLLEICSDEGVDPEQAAYVGDSLARDILMAKSAGVFAIWAKYGADHAPLDYDRLVRISHWSAADVRKEKELRQVAQGIKPDYVLENGFDEILPVLIVGDASKRTY